MELEKIRNILEKCSNDGESHVDEVMVIFKKVIGNPTDYDITSFMNRLETFFKPDIDMYYVLIKAVTESISVDYPKWDYIAGEIFYNKITREVKENNKGKTTISEIVAIHPHLFLNDIKEFYTRKEMDTVENYLLSTYDRHLNFNYSSLLLLYERYLHRTLDGGVIVTPLQHFMLIALFLGMNDKKEERLSNVIKYYDLLSKFKVTVATPTLSNSFKPIPQLSSCFIDTMPDSLDGIYNTITNFAKVSKLGGGMGIYIGKVRATGSPIRGYKGKSGGIIRWIRLINDTAVAVDQLGVRSGACAVYCDLWHKDIPEFLQLRTNNGDDRMKAHDIFPALCVPDYFWHLTETNRNTDWVMMCPYEINKYRGYHLEDYFGEEWTEKYKECVADERISKRTMKVKDMIKLIIKSAVETGTPFIFNRDTVNKFNPNKHIGSIYCSNLCSEIAQSMKEITNFAQYTKPADKDSNSHPYVFDSHISGHFVVCNLASIVLPNIESDEDLKNTVTVLVRMLNNVIDLNYYPVEYARITNKDVRPIGIGTSGYHHYLVKKGIRFESEEHLQEVDKLYEKINYYAIQASCDLAKEFGPYKYFKGSEWENGNYFTDRNYDSEEWVKLRNDVKENGMYNGYLMAVAPTGSTSIISNTTASVDPIMKKFFMEEKKNQMVPRVAPDLTMKTFWLYKNAHDINQDYIVKSAGIRQRHIDQSQSVNIYITNEYKFSQILDIYINAWKYGVKTLYYTRSVAMEIEDCESCSA